MTLRKTTLLVALSLAGAPYARGADPEPTPAAAAPAAAPAGAPTARSAYGGELLDELEAAAKEAVMLAEAMPAEKYAWRPGPGVRSVSEVFMHLAWGNYLILSFTGEPKPEGLSRESEKTITDKAKVVETLKTSFAFAQRSLAARTDADLSKPAKFFGKDTTVRALYVRALSHAWEHTGQSVAYARVNGVVPPWSEK